jgi:hypothetical protein
MPLDERISQLSDAIIQEVRSPIEAALHRLLADVMAMAAADRDAAVQDAVARAAASHESALSAEQTGKAEAVAQAVGLRVEELARQHEEAIAGLRDQLAAEHEHALAALRAELEQERNTALAGLRDQLAGERAGALTALREDLEWERESAIAALRDELVAAHAAALSTVREELERERESALGAAAEEAARDRDAAINAAREDAARRHDAELQALNDKAATDRDGAVQAALEELIREHESALAVLASQAAVEPQAAEGDPAAAPTAGALAEAQRARLLAESKVAELEEALADARIAQVRSEAARLAAEEQVQLAHTSERQSELACSERMVEAFRQLDDAQTLSDVLAVLAEQTAVAAGRVAVLLVDGGRLRAWDVRGWPDVAPASVDLPIDPGGVFGRAVSTGLPVSTSDVAAEVGGSGPLIAAPEGRAGLAVPVSVGGRVVAVVYADDAGDRLPVVPSNWPEIAEILARHAGHRLEVLTISRAAALAKGVQREGGAPEVRPADPSPFADERREEESARRYARLLISEIKLYNEAAVEQGRQERDLVGRLGPDIERARRLYEEKIPAAVRHRVDCFDEEVVRTLAGGDPGLLGHTP